FCPLSFVFLPLLSDRLSATSSAAWRRGDAQSGEVDSEVELGTPGRGPEVNGQVARSDVAGTEPADQTNARRGGVRSGRAAGRGGPRATRPPAEHRVERAG